MAADGPKNTEEALLQLWHANCRAFLLRGGQCGRWSRFLLRRMVMRTPHRTAGRRAAFTLIELLVVVAIIALLISILLPSLARAREIAKRTACGANLSAFGRSVLTYAEGERGSLPNCPVNPTVGNFLFGGTTTVGYNRGLSDDKLINGSASTVRAYCKLLTGGRRAYMQPKQWICPSAQATREHRAQGGIIVYYNNGVEVPLFELSGSQGTHASQGDSEMADFSYSFQVTSQHTFGNETRGIAPTTTQDPRKALAADRNPYSNHIISASADPTQLTPSDPGGRGVYTFSTTNTPKGFPLPPQGADLNYTLALRRPRGVLAGQPYATNSRNHNLDGQNVLRLDGSCKWQTSAKCGADDDCIWTTMTDDGQFDQSPTATESPGAATSDAHSLGGMRSRSNWLTDSILAP
jgi:prepilin-type N-terminal cleavage/methylation domain-containing protein